jgi:RNase P subunit RPR2
MKQRIFLCKHCHHELIPPRAGIRLQEVKSWFRYSHCPTCKHELRVIEQVPEPVGPAATQQSLWTGESMSPFT